MEFEDTASILNEVEQQNQEESKPEETPVEQTEPQESSKPDAPFVQINHKGQMRDFTQSQTVEYAQKGFDYETKMSEFKKTKEAFEVDSSRFENWKERNARVEEIDKYYQDNPEKLQYLLEAYDKKPEEGDSQEVNELKQTIQTLQSDITELKEFKNAEYTEKVHTETMQTFGYLKKEHEYLNWEVKDSDGLKLEDYILKFATDNKIPDIEAATLRYCKDQILDNAKENGRKAAIDAVKEGSKQGVTSVGTAPKTTPKPLSTDTSKSWDEIARDAISEVEQGNFG